MIKKKESLRKMMTAKKTGDGKGQNQMAQKT